MKKIIKVKGMHCNSCEILLKEAIEELGIKVLQADHVDGKIVVDLKEEKQLNSIKQAIEKEGYAME